MARIKGGLNAKKKHNRILKMAKGLKQAGVVMNRKVLSDMAINDAEGFAKLAELAKSKKREKETVQTAVDRSYQRSSTYQWSVLQQVHVRLKAGWC